MSPVNSAKWEEGSNIAVDQEVEAAAAGWTLNYASVYRTGRLVAVHIEATFAAGAAALVTTLQGDFAPGATVKTIDGKFTVGTDGKVQFPGSTAGGGTAVCDLNYLAGVGSP